MKKKESALDSIKILKYSMKINNNVLEEQDVPTDQGKHKLILTNFTQFTYFEFKFYLIHLKWESLKA